MGDLHPLDEGLLNAGTLLSLEIHSDICVSASICILSKKRGSHYCKKKNSQKKMLKGAKSLPRCLLVSFNPQSEVTPV